MNPVECVTNLRGSRKSAILVQTPVNCTQLLGIRTNPRIYRRLGKYDICCGFAAISRHLIINRHFYQASG
jgi:hypothetical protein